MQNEKMEVWKTQLQEYFYNEVDITREVTDEEISEMLNAGLHALAKECYISVLERQIVKKNVFYAVRKLDVLQTLLDDDSITEIMINGYDTIYVERAGRLFRWDKTFDSKEKLEDVVQQITSACNRTVNEASPIVDARLPNGARVNVVLPPVALNGPIVTIRRFPEHPIQMEDLIRFGALDKEVADFLKMLVKAKYNIFISGGTGSGKTTFLNALSSFIPSEERIITIEDSAELQIQGIGNLVRLETRAMNGEGSREITIRDLIKASLRMRPDRVVVGEIRGAEAVDLLSAMNTGHDGSLSTGHGNSPGDMLSRMETMVLMGMDIPLESVRRQIASAIDIMVHLGRLRDKSRKVLEISEITGMDNGEIQIRPLYIFEEEKEVEGKILGKLVSKQSLFAVDKLKAAGLYQ